MNTRNNAVTPAGPVQRVIDFRVNVWHLIGAAFTVIAFGIQSYMTQQNLVTTVRAQTDEISALKQEIKSGSSNVLNISASLSLVSFRVERLELDMRAMNDKAPPNKGRP